MTAPTQRSGGPDANARGIAVLVAAVAIGFLLLLKAGDGGGNSTLLASSGKTTTTVDIGGIGSSTTTSPGSGSSTTTTTTTATGSGRQPSQVKVLVLNADGPAGSAATTSQTIGARGYKMGSPANANAGVTLPKTAVYFAPGYQAEATAVALVLGKTGDIVAAMPSPVPGPGADTANVVVVIGKDSLSAGSSGGSSTTTTPGSRSSSSTTSTTAGN